MDAAKPLSMRDVIRWLVLTLTGMARRKEYGEVTIKVQAGQIVFVNQNVSYRDRLPEIPAGVEQRDAERVTRQLAIVG